MEQEYLTVITTLAKSSLKSIPSAIFPRNTPNKRAPITSPGLPVEFLMQELNSSITLDILFLSRGSQSTSLTLASFSINPVIVHLKSNKDKEIYLRINTLKKNWSLTIQQGTKRIQGKQIVESKEERSENTS